VKKAVGVLYIKLRESQELVFYFVLNGTVLYIYEGWVLKEDGILTFIVRLLIRHFYSCFVCFSLAGKKNLYLLKIGELVSLRGLGGGVSC
jgi:hypothetical protein